MRSEIGFCGLLGLLFIALKLTHFIDWSWAWVLAPLWFPAAAVFGLALAILLCYAACEGIGWLAKRAWSAVGRLFDRLEDK